MRKKLALLASVLALALALSGCKEKEYPKEPLDLYGEWSQDSSEAYYHIATIDPAGIRVYWYVPSDNTHQPYWLGSYTPPTDGREPYIWESVNDLELAKRFVRASREESKQFTYQDGKITYGMMIGRFKSIVTLERAEVVAERQRQRQEEQEREQREQEEKEARKQEGFHLFG